MKRALPMILGVLMGTTGVTSTYASTPKGALGAVATSRDGHLLVVAGDNRVLSVLDPASLEVKQRVWIKTNPLEMYFSKDATVLMITSTDSEVYFYDTATWELKSTLDDVDQVAYAAEADLLVGLDDGYKESTLKLITPSDGKVSTTFKLGGGLAAIGVTPDAAQFAVLTDPDKSDKETKEKAPKGLKGLDETLFELQHDGKTARILWFDGSGKQIRELETWYSPGTTDTRILMPDDKNLYIVNYPNDNAHVVGEKVTLFELSNSVNYGHGTSPQQSWIGSGGLRNGTIAKLGGGLPQGNTFKMDKLPGWPEYFEGFAVTDDGVAFGVTTAYRLARITADGKIEKTVPIF